jgi:hypothetical protein
LAPLIEDCKDLNEWSEEVGRAFRTDRKFESDKNLINKIVQYFERHLEDGEVMWSNSIGAPIRV